MKLLAYSLTFLAAARAVQVNQPFLSAPEDLPEWDLDTATRTTQIKQASISQPEDRQEWNIDLDAIPDANSTGRFIFDGLASLLQQWTNTRYRNGHNIVPGTIAPNTLLYHCRGNIAVPDVPEWVATDPEHAILFCNETGWLLTLVSTRPLKVLYFDGSSAAYMPGAFDCQDIVLFGEVRPHDSVPISDRINGLCEWGKDFNLDGFVRMQMDFEIMLCNFTAGVETLSMVNLHTGFDIFHFPLPTINPEVFETLSASSWHRAYPETRIQVDATRLVSFYDTALAPSLVETRRRQKRQQHRLVNLTKADARAYMDRLEQVLRSSPEPNSGVDWQTLARGIVYRFAERLELLSYILKDTSGGLHGNFTTQAKKAHGKLRSMMQPYLSLSAIPANSSIASLGDVSWAMPIYKQCATAHTSYAMKLADKLAPSEKTILAAVRETTREICRVTARMWAEGFNAGLDRLLHPADFTEPSSDDLKNLLSKWRTDASKLMDWLDWSIWLKCDPACGAEEMCYMPTWPFFRGGMPEFRTGEYESDWKNPQPYCIRRIEPYSLF